MLIYGIVLFSNIDDFIYYPAINIFMAKNLVPILLADVYYYLYVIHKKKNDIVMFCVPLLYTWLMFHMPQEDPFTSEKCKWPQKLASFSSKSVIWYKWEYELESIILSYRDFLNVPLIGSHGALTITLSYL